MTLMPCTLALADLRQAAQLDAAVPLFDAYRQFYGQPSDPAAARAFLAARATHGESVVFLARDASGAAVGFMQLYPGYSSVSLAPSCVLNDLYVAPAARRGGLGRALLQAAERWAREQGVPRLTLATQVTNTRAQALYEGAGWRRATSFYNYTSSFALLQDAA